MKLFETYLRVISVTLDFLDVTFTIVYKICKQFVKALEKKKLKKRTRPNVNMPVVTFVLFLSVPKL